MGPKEERISVDFRGGAYIRRFSTLSETGSRQRDSHSMRRQSGQTFLPFGEDPCICVGTACVWVSVSRKCQFNSSDVRKQALKNDTYVTVNKFVPMV